MGKEQLQLSTNLRGKETLPRQSTSNHFVKPRLRSTRILILNKTVPEPFETRSATESQPSSEQSEVQDSQRNEAKVAQIDKDHFLPDITLTKEKVISTLSKEKSKLFLSRIPYLNHGKLVEPESGSKPNTCTQKYLVETENGPSSKISIQLPAANQTKQVFHTKRIHMPQKEGSRGKLNIATPKITFRSYQKNRDVPKRTAAGKTPVPPSVLVHCTKNIPGNDGTERENENQKCASNSKQKVLHSVLVNSEKNNLESEQKGNSSSKIGPKPSYSYSSINWNSCLSQSQKKQRVVFREGTPEVVSVIAREPTIVLGQRTWSTKQALKPTRTYANQGQEVKPILKRDNFPDTIPSNHSRRNSLAKIDDPLHRNAKPMSNWSNSGKVLAYLGIKVRLKTRNRSSRKKPTIKCSQEFATIMDKMEESDSASSSY